MTLRYFELILSSTWFVSTLFAQPGVVVQVPADGVQKTGAGRLTVYIEHLSSKGAPTTQSINRFDTILGYDVPALHPGDSIKLPDSADHFGKAVKELPGGDYIAQAVFDWHADDSNWKREPGNLYSEVTAFEIPAHSDKAGIWVIPISLSHVVEPVQYPSTQAAEVFEVESTLLTQFFHRPMALRAGVIFPTHLDPTRSYPAIYWIPGFGGNGISMVGNPTPTLESSLEGVELAKSVFTIWLDPESGNGHTLFANSDNNGPRADALIQELIPALEKKYHLIPKPEARIVRGHSSGGWAALWLATQYPQTFGACFCASPDPVDFHHLERINIYDTDNAYIHDGVEIFGARKITTDPATVREENAKEEVIGPHNTSAHDWDAWQAAWGHRAADEKVADLYDPRTGAIHRDEAESYRRFDIADLLRTHPERFASIFRHNVRLVVGDEDNFFLDEAVVGLKHVLDSISPDPTDVSSGGYIKVLHGYNHGTIREAPETKHWQVEMLNHLRDSGLIDEAKK